MTSNQIGASYSSEVSWLLIHLSSRSYACYTYNIWRL